MSSKIINPSLRIHSNPNIQSSKTQSPQNISFNSQLAKSRIPTRNNRTGPPSARLTAQSSAFYAAQAQSKETLYELLGIAESVSSFSDIKKAYKDMARKYHPDVSPPDRVDEHTRRFIMVHEAYETLSNPHTRALYDRDLAFGAGFSTSPRKHQEERGDWRSSWQSQLNELQRRDCGERSSWGARMRNY